MALAGEFTRKSCNLIFDDCLKRRRAVEKLLRARLQLIETQGRRERSKKRGAKDVGKLNLPYCGSISIRENATAERTRRHKNPLKKGKSSGERKINAAIRDWVTKLFEEEREEDREDRP